MEETILPGVNLLTLLFFSVISIKLAFFLNSRIIFLSSSERSLPYALLNASMALSNKLDSIVTRSALSISSPARSPDMHNLSPRFSAFAYLSAIITSAMSLPLLYGGAAASICSAMESI